MYNYVLCIFYLSLVLWIMKYLSIHTTPENSGARERQWPVDYWVGLLRRLIKDEWFIVSIGTKDDWTYNQRIFTQLSIQERFYLLDTIGSTQNISDVVSLWKSLDCKMLICVNSGIMHVAVGVQLPVVAIVGATPAKVILPDSPEVRWLEDPSLKDYDPQHKPGTLLPSRMHEISVDMVMDKIKELG